MTAIAVDTEERISISVSRSAGDRAYRGVATAAGSVTFIVMGLIGGYLVVRGWDALSARGSGFFTEFQWGQPGQPYGIGAVFFFTIQIALTAMALAVPVSVAAALFVVEYAPLWARRVLTSTISLLAAVPSLIYGMWGYFYLQPRLINFSRWLAENLDAIPIFRVQSRIEGIPVALGDYGGSTFVTGAVVALMVVPIGTSVMIEVFSQAPPGEREGALALGGTRWGVVRDVVLPFGRGGIIGGSMLGLGRALGETIAVTYLISQSFDPTLSILGQGSNSFAALIALRVSEADSASISALLAAGLVLFVLTLIVNSIASVIVANSRSGAATEI